MGVFGMSDSAYSRAISTSTATCEIRSRFARRGTAWQ